MSKNRKTERQKDSKSSAIFKLYQKLSSHPPSRLTTHCGLSPNPILKRSLPATPAWTIKLQDEIALFAIDKSLGTMRNKDYAFQKPGNRICYLFILNQLYMVFLEQLVCLYFINPKFS